jgi:hypothetical protein
MLAGVQLMILKLDLTVEQFYQLTVMLNGPHNQLAPRSELRSETRPKFARIMAVKGEASNHHITAPDLSVTLELRSNFHVPEYGQINVPSSYLLQLMLAMGQFPVE